MRRGTDGWGDREAELVARVGERLVARGFHNADGWKLDISSESHEMKISFVFGFYFKIPNTMLNLSVEANECRYAYSSLVKAEDEVRRVLH